MSSSFREARTICRSDHEISREDRDLYINIHFDNIKKGHKSNFLKCSERGKKCSTFEEPYDYTSVMHYKKTAFTNGKGPTITTKNPIFGDFTGYHDAASLGDARRVQLLYKCPGKAQCYCKILDIKHCF